MSTRLVRTCTECKQVKLRCDAKDRFPEPCSRCHTRRLFCTVDATFRRTPARSRLEALNSELQALRGQRRNPDGQTGLSPRGTDAAGSGASAVPEQETSSSDSLQEDDLSLHTDCVILDDVAVEPFTAIEAFRIFATVFRPQLPIFGPVSIGRIYRHQPLLFWTIVVTVAFQLPSPLFLGVRERLQQPYMNMLQRQILQAPLPLHTIQALLLLCHWPLPCEKQSQDPSGLYCGLAVQGARFMSLDRQQPAPSLESLGIASEALHARLSTWLGCFFVSTSLGMHLGLPAPIGSDLDIPGIHSVLSHAPHEFSFHIRAHLVAAKFLPLLHHDLGSPAASSVVRIADAELDIVKTEASSSGMDEGPLRLIELAVLSVKLHLYALLITKSHLQKASTSPDPVPQMVLHKALDVALRIIDISTWDLRRIKAGSTPTASPDAICTALRQRCLPKNHFRCLALATATLLRFFRRSTDKADCSGLRITVKNHVAMALDYLKSCSTHPRDEYGRAASLFEAHVRRASAEPAAPSDQTEPRLRITQRMGVSILLDSILESHETRGKAVVDSKHMTPPNEGHYQGATEQQGAQADVAAPQGLDDSWNQSPNPEEIDLDLLWGLSNDPFRSLLDSELVSFDTAQLGVGG